MKPTKQIIKRLETIIVKLECWQVRYAALHDPSRKANSAKSELIALVGQLEARREMK